MNARRVEDEVEVIITTITTITTRAT